MLVLAAIIALLAAHWSSASTTTTPVRSPSQHERLLQWAHNQSFDLSGVELTSTGGTFLAAKYDTLAGDTLLAVPVEAVITTHLAWDKPHEQSVGNMGDPFRKLVMVVLFEMELGKESPFHGYFQQQQQQQPNDTLMHWSKDDLAQLQDADVVRQTQDALAHDEANFTRMYDLLHHFHLPFEHLSFPAYLQAKHFTMLRATPRLGGSEGHLAIVPVLELVSSSAGAAQRKRAINARISLVRNSHVRLTATVDMVAGTRLVLRRPHDTYNNVHALEHRGRLLLLSSTRGQRASSSSVLATNLHEAVVVATAASGASTTVRLYSGRIRPLETVRQFGGGGGDTALWWRWEAHARPALVQCTKALQAKLRQFPTTYMQDVLLLHGLRAGRLRIAVQFRMERKRVIMRHLSFCREVVTRAKCLRFANDSGAAATWRYLHLVSNVAAMH